VKLSVLGKKGGIIPHPEAQQEEKFFTHIKLSSTERLGVSSFWIAVEQSRGKPADSKDFLD
jgi:hypothetical protein